MRRIDAHAHFLQEKAMKLPERTRREIGGRVVSEVRGKWNGRFVRAALESASSLALGMSVTLVTTTAQAQQATREARPRTAAPPPASATATKHTPPPTARSTPPPRPPAEARTNSTIGHTEVISHISVRPLAHFFRFHNWKTKPRKRSALIPIVGSAVNASHRQSYH